MAINWSEFTVAELRGRASEEAFRSAGRHIVELDGPHEDEWSLYATITLDDGQELETILHHRAGKPLSGECSCAPGRAGVFCSHLVWIGLTHLGLDAPPEAVVAGRTTLDGTRAARVALLAGLSREELDAIGGGDEQD